MNFKSKVLLISFLSIALWHCRNKTDLGGDTHPPPTSPDLPDPPDLTVEISTSSTIVVPSEVLTLTATISNIGESSPAVTLRWYLSTDSTIDMSDTLAGTAAVSSLGGEGEISISDTVTAPDTVGTYHYGACVDTVTDESDTNNNCSSAVKVVVSDPDVMGPDLTVSTIRASRANVAPFAMLTLTAAVSNMGGGGPSPAVTLRWYLSTDSTIDMSDTQLGAVSSSLGGEGELTISNTVTAPGTVGTYHYGACVDTVTDESDTNNNCSSAVTILVSTQLPLPTSDFTTLTAAGNRNPRGIWSNGVTLWVADRSDTKLYAYKMSDKTRDLTKDIALDTDNSSPEGIWSDGVTLWVVDFLEGKLYAYKMSDKTRDPSKDFILAAGNTTPTGIWSNGTTLWVADTVDDKLYAYKMSDKTRDADKDFAALTTAGNTFPQGIWSNGVTLWVADWDDDQLYAYKMSDKTRDLAKDITTLRATGNTSPTGIWSNGVTLWVADWDDHKLYAYDIQ